MRHIKPLTIKLIAIFIILWVILGNIYDLSTRDDLAITLAFSLVEYLIGDLILLHYTNNFIGTIGDFGLAMAIIYVMTRDIAVTDEALTATLYASFAITFFECFFHKYMYRHVHSHFKNRHKENIATS